MSAVWSDCSLHVGWFDTETNYIKTHGSESLGQEEAACMHVFLPTRPLQRVIYTDGCSNFLKCCNSATIAVLLT